MRPCLRHVEIVKIDGLSAIDLLALNTANRPVSLSRVHILARKMMEGRWLFTGQAHVIISSNDVLLNGQHTLLAVVEADAVIETVLVTGVDPVAFAAIDIGWKRTVGNVLAVGGTRNANSVASILRLVIQYDALARNERGWTFPSPIDADEIMPVFEADAEGFQAAAVQGRHTQGQARHTGVTLSGSVAGGFYYLALRQGYAPVVVESFLDRVGSDTGHGVHDPALALRRWLIGKSARPTSGPDRALRDLSGWIKAFRASRDGRQLAKIYAWVRDAPDYPRL